MLCKGDGLCCAKCPTDAIVLKHFTDEEVVNQIDAALSEPWGCRRGDGSDERRRRGAWQDSGTRRGSSLSSATGERIPLRTCLA